MEIPDLPAGTDRGGNLKAGADQLALELAVAGNATVSPAPASNPVPSPGIPAAERPPARQAEPSPAAGRPGETEPILAAKPVPEAGLALEKQIAPAAEPAPVTQPGAELEPAPVAAPAASVPTQTPSAPPAALREPAPGAEAVEEGDPCPACDHRQSRLLFRGSDRLYGTTREVFSIVECAACRLIRLSPWPVPAVLRRYYPESYWYVPEQDTVSLLEESYRRFVLRDHVHFVEKVLQRTGKDGLLLDVGCGGGLFLRMMAERGCRVAGLDFSLNAASTAWRQNGVAAVCGSLARPPIPPASCVVVTMFHVLEHLYDPTSYLEAALDLLKPEGRLVVQVPNAACWQFLLLGEAWSGIDIPRHLFHFRLRDLEILLDRCGFEIERVKHFSLRDNPAGLATSIAPGLDPMARRIRGAKESSRQRLLRDMAYFGLVLLSLPFTLLEAACRAGSTVMVEARKKI